MVDKQENYAQARQALRRRLRMGAWVMLGVVVAAWTALVWLFFWLMAKGLLAALMNAVRGAA